MTNITNTLANFAVYRFFRRIDKQEKKLARNYARLNLISIIMAKSRLEKTTLMDILWTIVNVDRGEEFELHVDTLKNLEMEALRGPYRALVNEYFKALYDDTKI